MKKILLTFVAALVVASASAFSFDWGVTGGLNYTKVDLKNAAALKDGSNQAGWFIGARANVGLIAGISLNGALVFNQNKLQVESLDGVGMTETERSFSVPLNVRYNIGLGKTGIYVGTGPQFDFMIGDKEWGNNFKRDNMASSWNISAGVKVLGKIELGASYNFALGSIGKALVDQVSSGQIPTGGVELKRNTLSIQATYYF